jgi:hypothetical protein
MNNKFEEFIKETIKNTSGSLPPSEKSWAAIENKIRKRRVWIIVARLSVAASVLLLIGLGYLFLQDDNKSQAYCDATTLELNETTMYYSGLIDVKYKQLTQIKNIDKEYFQLFFTELEQLDEKQKMYLNDLRNYGPQVDIVRALVENQRQKLLVLNRLLNEIEKVRSYENKDHNI